MIWLVLRIWARLAGFKEAVLYSLKGAEAFAYDEHRDWTRERITVAAAAVVGILEAALLHWLKLPTAVLVTWPLTQLVAWSLVFSYDHNQRYYQTRAAISGQPFDPHYSSSTSTARWEFNFETRSLLRMLAWMVLLAYWAFSLLILAF